MFQGQFGQSRNTITNIITLLSSEFFGLQQSEGIENNFINLKVSICTVANHLPLNFFYFL